MTGPPLDLDRLQRASDDYDCWEESPIGKPELDALIAAARRERIYEQALTNIKEPAPRDTVAVLRDIARAALACARGETSG